MSHHHHLKSASYIHIRPRSGLTVVFSWTELTHVCCKIEPPVSLYFFGWPFPDVQDSLAPFLYLLVGFALFLTVGRHCPFLIILAGLAIFWYFWGRHHPFLIFSGRHCPFLFFYSIFWWTCPFLIIFDRPCPFLIFLGIACSFPTYFWQVLPFSDKFGRPCPFLICFGSSEPF